MKFLSALKFLSLTRFESFVPLNEILLPAKTSCKSFETLLQIDRNVPSGTAAWSSINIARN